MLSVDLFSFLAFVVKVADIYLLLVPFIFIILSTTTTTPTKPILANFVDVVHHYSIIY